MKKILIVAGPTASGKSALAIELAKRFNGEIISCDSMQIYRDLNAGTAKISADEMQGVPHHMLDVADAGEEYSVCEYSEAAKRVIDDIYSRGRLPVVAGGTGLYIESLIYPLNFAVNKDEKVRERLLKELDEYGAEKLHARLAELDPVDAAKIHPNNTKRLIRALEIIEISGDTKNKDELKKPQYDVCLIALDTNRKKLYENIDERVERMFASGLEREVKDLVDRGVVDKNSQSMQAIGYKEFFDYFDGNASLEEVKELIKHNTRRYAKRQITWLRRYPFAHWIAPEDREIIFETIQEFIKG